MTSRSQQANSMSVNEQKQILELHNTGHCGVAVTVSTWTQGGQAKSSDVAATMAKFLDSQAPKQNEPK